MAYLVPDKGSQIYNVKAYGAKGDGATDDYASIAAAITAAGTRNGVVFFPPGVYFTSATLSITTPIQLIGSGSSNVDTNAGTVIRPAAGITGISIGVSATYSVLKDFMLESRSTALGTDDGIRYVASYCQFENVYIYGFGRYGIACDTSVSGNANHCTLINVQSSQNYSHGFYIYGSNSNVQTFINLSAVANQGWGLYEDLSLNNTYVNPHIDNSTRTGAPGALYAGGASPTYLNVYVENAAGTGQNVTLGAHGNGGYFTTGASFHGTITQANAGAWVISRSGTGNLGQSLETGYINALSGTVSATGTGGGLATKVKNSIPLDADWTGSSYPTPLDGTITADTTGKQLWLRSGTWNNIPSVASSPVWTGTATYNGPQGSATRGSLNIGTGLFDGSAGAFAGISTNTGLALNMATGWTGNFLEGDVAGTTKFYIDQNGTLTTRGNINLALGTSVLQLNGSAGISGQVLTSAGATTLPTWSTPTTPAHASTHGQGGSDQLSIEFAHNIVGGVARHEVFPRWAMSGASIAQNVGAGQLSIVYFTATGSVSVSKASWLQSNLSAGCTLQRIGLYDSNDAGDLTTLRASCANQTNAMFGSPQVANTLNSVNFSSSYTLVAGQRYAIAFISVGGTTQASLDAITVVNTAQAAILISSPRIAASVASQTDLPTSMTAASYSTTQIIAWWLAVS